jgi:V-type H+-transporting ATPase subunit E
LRILKTQEEAVQAAVNKASTQLFNITKDQEKYKTLLRQLLVEVNLDLTTRCAISFVQYCTNTNAATYHSRKSVVLTVEQGMTKIDEPAISVRCRQEDRALVESVLHGAEQDYQSLKKKSCKLTLDSKTFLPPGTASGASQETCAGGVALSAQEGRILVNNSLDMRLKYAFEVALPEIRHRLFGDATH